MQSQGDGASFLPSAPLSAQALDASGAVIGAAAIAQVYEAF